MQYHYSSLLTPYKLAICQVFGDPRVLSMSSHIILQKLRDV